MTTTQNTTLRAVSAARGTIAGLLLAFAAVPGLLLPALAESAPSVTDSERIGEQVETALANAAYISMKGMVTSGESRKIRFESHMTPTRLITRMYEGDTLSLVIEWHGTRAKEYRPLMEKRPVFEYDAPTPSGPDDTIFKSKLDCLIGSYMQTWVGPESEKGSFFRGRIEHGERLADADVNDRMCYVFRETRAYHDESGNETAKVEQVVYVDQENFLVRRWDTTNDGVERIRIYDTTISDTIPSGIEWDLVVQNPD